jgi:hypothetical protein
MARNLADRADHFKTTRGGSGGSTAPIRDAA